MKKKGVNVVASNNSWGGGGPDPALRDAIARADVEGILFIAAAGNSNSNNDVSPFFPCNYDVPNVICVASTDHNDNKSGFSSFGATTVDLGAPGSSILSTIPAGSPGSDSYAHFSGTSMATPHVVGGAALVEGCKPSLTHQQIKSILFDTVRKIPALNGITVTGGVVNYSAALNDARVGACDPLPVSNAPTADPGGPYRGRSGRPVNFDGSGSSDSDGKVLLYSWDFGDGLHGAGVKPSHTYRNKGTYTVKLVVRDDSGQTSATATTTATIRGK